MSKKITKSDLFYFLLPLLFIFICQFFKTYLTFTYLLNLMLIFTIFTVKSQSLLQKSMGVVAFSSFVLMSIIPYYHIGFWSLVLMCIFLSGVCYIYDDSSIELSVSVNMYRKIKSVLLLLSGVFVFMAGLPFSLIQLFWSGTFLEVGGDTALLFGFVLFMEQFLNKMYRQMVEDEKLKILSDKPKPDSSLLIKILTAWLFVLDFSIVTYVFQPNNKGFGFALTFAILTIFLSTLVRPTYSEYDIFDGFYQKVRPFQGIMLLLLLVSYEQTLTLGLFYLTLAVVAHIVWSLNFMNTKQLLIFEVLLLFFPLFGYVSNPYRFVTFERPKTIDVLMQKNETRVPLPVDEDTFHF